MPALWLFFITLAAGIAYLSFQSGEETKKLGEQFILQLAQNINHKQNVSAAEINALTYDIRQGGRALAFLYLESSELLQCMSPAQSGIGESRRLSLLLCFLPLHF